MLATIILIAIIIGVLKIVMPDMGDTVSMILSLFLTLTLGYFLFKVLMHTINWIDSFI